MCVFVCTSTHAVIYMYVNDDELHMLKSKINYSVLFCTYSNMNYHNQTVHEHCQIVKDIKY